METLRESLPNRLLLKRDLLCAGNPAHEEIKTLLLVSGGGMRGAYGAGVGIGLHHLGLADCFDVVVGISTGAAIGGYFLTGTECARHGARIYHEECLDKFVRYGTSLWPTVDIDYLEDVFRHGEKALDLAALKRHRSRFFVGVTEWETGKGILIDAKNASPDTIAAIKASLALTYVYKMPVMVNGGPYTDGGMSEPLPVRMIQEMFAPTDILLISHYSWEEGHAMGCSWAEKLANMVLCRRMPLLLRDPFRARCARWVENLTLLENSSHNVGMLWGGSDVQILTQDRAKLIAATEKGIRDALTFFGDETPASTLMP